MISESTALLTASTAARVAVIGTLSCAVAAPSNETLFHVVPFLPDSR